MTGNHTTTTITTRAATDAGGTRTTGTPPTTGPATTTNPATTTGLTATTGTTRATRATGPAAPTVPRPRRAPAGRRPAGPAGSGPAQAGRGTTRTVGRPGRPAAPGAPLPTVGAQRRAHESRPHHWFAHQLVRTLSGQQPVHALLGHALPAAYDRLVELAPLAPLRPLPAPGRRGAVPTLRECGLCRPRSGVIEAFARIAAGERLRALAFRLELGADARWRCAALDIGPAPALPSPAP
ncbi:Rv3235 family protein [Streptomyces sp. NPDC050355]|uniref:Rv3235 family protein n=1 Tax=Streptomyces sp. NPDC050355 TaxID=3365609 RepID=UPI00379B3733